MTGHLLGHTMKALSRRLLELCGGQEAAAMIPDMPVDRHQSFSDYGNPALPKRQIRCDVALLLERDCGQPLITAEMARFHGYMLVKLPRLAATGKPLGRVTAEALKENSEVFAALGGALDDGKLDAGEAARLGGEIDQAVTLLLQLRAQIDLEAGRAE